MGSGHDFPALGFDPAPGDVATVQHLADAFRSGGGAVGQAHDAVAGLNITGIWNGNGAQQAQGDIGKLAGGIGDRGSALTNAGKVLDQWAGELTSYQSKAADLEAQAEKAQRRLQAAQGNPDLKLAGQEFEDERSAHDAQQRYQTAVNEKQQAQQSLDGIKQQAQQLNQRHEQTAEAHATALKGGPAPMSPPTPSPAPPRTTSPQPTSPQSTFPSSPRSTSPQSVGQGTVDAARKQLGVMYAWGGGDLNGPHKPAPGTENTDSSGSAKAHDDDNVNGFDCSGLVRYAVYQSTGKDVGHYTFDQIGNFTNAGEGISTDPSQFQPGDIVYFDNGNHVAIYEGNGNVIEAPQSGEQVRETPLSAEGPVYFAARPK